MPVNLLTSNADLRGSSPIRVSNALKDLLFGEYKDAKPSSRIPAIICCLCYLADSGDDELLNDAVDLVAKFYASSTQWIQSKLIDEIRQSHHFLVSTLIVQRFSHWRDGTSIPRHLLFDAAFNLDYSLNLAESYAMGYGTNSSFNLGIPSDGEVKDPRVITLPPVSRISMSNGHSLFLTKAGEVYGCGNGINGQLGVGLLGRVVHPAKITFPHQKSESSPKIIDVAAVESHSVFISSRSVFVCGLNAKGSISIRPSLPLDSDLPMASIFLIKNEDDDERLEQILAHPCFTLIKSTRKCYLMGEGYCQLTPIPSHELALYLCRLDANTNKLGVACDEASIYVNEFRRNPELMMHLSIPGSTHAESIEVALSTMDADVSECVYMPSKYPRILLSTIKGRSITKKCYISINGLLTHIHIIHCFGSATGNVTIVGCPISRLDFTVSDGTTWTPKGACIYRGQARLIRDFVDMDEYFTVPRYLQQSSTDSYDPALNLGNYSVLLDLQEVPGTHSVHFMEMSPDCENVIFTVDNDKMPSSHGRESHWASLQLIRQRDMSWHSTNLSAINESRLEYGLEAYEMDVKIRMSYRCGPHKDDMRSIEEPSTRDAVALWLPAVFPHLTEAGVLDLDTALPLLVAKVNSTKCDFDSYPMSEVKFMVFKFLSGVDVFNPLLLSSQVMEKYNDARLEAQQQQPRAPFPRSVEDEDNDEIAHRTLCFDELFEKISAIIPILGLELRRQCDHIWRLVLTDDVDPLEDLPVQLPSDCVLVANDGQELVFNHRILAFYSTYFEVAIHYKADTDMASFNMDYSYDLICLAASVLIHASRLHSISLSQVLSLIDLFDHYMMVTQVDDCVQALFNRANEFTLGTLFSIYMSMTHLRPVVVRHFFRNIHLLLFWKGSSDAPIELIRDIHSYMQTDECGIKQPSQYYVAQSHLLAGGCYVPSVMRTYDNSMNQLFPLNWARIATADMEACLLGRGLRTAALNRELEMEASEARRLMQSGEQKLGLELYLKRHESLQLNVVYHAVPINFSEVDLSTSRNIPTASVMRTFIDSKKATIDNILGPLMMKLSLSDSKPSQRTPGKMNRPRRASHRVSESATTVVDMSSSFSPSSLPLPGTPEKQHTDDTDIPSFHADAVAEDQISSSPTTSTWLASAPKDIPCSPLNAWNVPSSPSVPLDSLSLTGELGSSPVAKKSSARFAPKGTKFRRASDLLEDPSLSRTPRMAPWCASVNSEAVASAGSPSLADIQSEQRRIDAENAKRLPPATSSLEVKGKKKGWAAVTPAKESSPLAVVSDAPVQPSLFSIMKDEKRKADKVRNPSSRPLEYVACEERAIEELTDLYHQNAGDEVVICVTRVDSNREEPSWGNVLVH